MPLPARLESQPESTPPSEPVPPPADVVIEDDGDYTITFTMRDPNA